MLELEVKYDFQALRIVIWLCQKRPLLTQSKAGSIRFVLEPAFYFSSCLRITE
jgi:hypothetical protein